MFCRSFEGNNGYVQYQGNVILSYVHPEPELNKLRKEKTMIDVSDLKSIIMLTYLKDSMLEKLAKVTLIREYSAGDTIFREGEDATHLYSVIEGKVGLEVMKNPSTPVMINTICENRTFGFSAVIETEEKKYITTAKAYMRTKLFAWKAEDLEALFQKDCEMGFLFMQRIAKIVKTRLQIRTIQYLDIYG